jgi:hypothetical protein
MFKPTDRQMSLDSPVLQLPDGAARRLRSSWAEPFQRKVLPILLGAEDDFADLYSDVGRPNWSTARLLGICYLQELYDMDDQRALDSLAFDVRWQHALGVTAEESYLSRRSLVGFRTRLVEVDPEMTKLRELFDCIADAALAALGRSSSRQRMDSTLVCSNITVRGRVDLFRKTLLHFLRGLSKQWPQKLERLDSELVALVEAAETKWFSAPTGEKRRILLATLARWLLDVRDAFATDEAVVADERYQLVCRVLDEHCEVSDGPDGDDGGDGGGDSAEQGSGDCTTSAASSSPKRIKLRRKQGTAGTALQSPYDPDATYGHKGKGYHVHVSETCGHGVTEVITDYEINGANEHDSTKADSILGRLVALGRSPETMYADGGYANGGNILAAAEMGIDLRAPVTRAKLPGDMVGRDQFEFDDKTGDVIGCPKGHPPIRHALRSTGRCHTRHAYFDGRTCEACELLGRCVVRKPNNGKRGSYHLDIEPNLRERDEALARQADRDWWLDYRIRSGVEGTPSELKRTHGMRKLRVRGGSRVALAIALKITACNIKRWLKAAVALERAVLGPDAVTSGHECVITLCGRTREGNARHESDEQPGSLAA